MGGEFAVEHRGGGQLRTGPESPDLLVARLASRQHGVAAARQLVRLGLTRRAIERRIGRGWLHPLHRGVYAIGHTAVSETGRWMAAVLAGGAEATLCSWSAAAFLGFAADDRQRVHVAVPRGMHSRPGICFHRLALRAEQRTTLHGIPVTTPARTLMDLAASAGENRLQRAVHEAEVRRLCTPRALMRALDDAGPIRGAAKLRRILAMSGGRALPTRSELEDRFLRFLRRRGLPLPETNQWVRTPRGRFEVDCLWREQRVVVELDGLRFHGTAIARERDSRKDRALAASGFPILRITWSALDDAAAVEADLRSALGLAEVAVDHREGG